MAHAIQTNGLTKEFTRGKKNTLAVNNVGLEVEDGELFGLLGPNGAGKTTLIKILCCLILPTKGKAQVAGIDIVKNEDKAKSVIGLVSGEERSFYWRLTGRQNLHFFSSLYNLPGAQARERINKLLDYLEIKEADKRFQEYSTGTKQRLAIARGLLHDPGIIFMDEPTKSLDPIAADNLRKFIKEKLVGEQKKTVFFATHNLKEAHELCSRLALMDKGEVKASGTVAQLRQQTGNPGSSIEEIFSWFIEKPENNNVT